MQHQPWGGKEHRPWIIVLGNEKGGSGKSTTALHLIIALLKRGFSVGSLDLDGRQGTLSRMLQNRGEFVAASGLRLPLPEHRRLLPSRAESRRAAEAEDGAVLDEAQAALAHNDFLVIDTPGNDTCLSRLGHRRADTLITPMNDSFLDLDLLAHIRSQGDEIQLAPSIYSQMVWEARQWRASQAMRPIDWIVMRNRLGHVDAHNKREIAEQLDKLQKRLHFRLAPGFGERVIFRQLFPKGLTLLDLMEPGAEVRLSMSHIAARQELRGLLQAIGLPREGENPLGAAEQPALPVVRTA